MLRVFHDKHILEMTNLSLLERIVVPFLKVKTRLDTETAPNVLYILKYKTWRGKTYIVSIERKEV